MGRFSTAQEAIEYLNNCHWDTKQQAVIRTRQLLGMLGDPQKKLKFVHVGGTNGKGSTVAMTESILRHAGYRTGMFPSPYIEVFSERIQVNAQLITDEALARITGIVADAADAMEDHPRHFELITAIGMLYFLECKCDIVVLEVGMGGEFDSTNVIDAPEAAVFTNIGLDHTQYLGDTIEEIAATKSGIIKPGTSVVLYDNLPSVKAVIETKAAECSAPVYYAADVKITPLSADLSGQTFEAEGRKYRIGLLGAHQLQNVRTVLKIVEVLRKKGWKIPEEAVRDGLADAKWPARFEVLSKDPVFILDGGHNPQCAEAIRASVEQYLPGRKITFLVGMLADKDYLHALRRLIPLADRFVTARPDSPRALTAKELADTLSEEGCLAEAADSVEAAIRKALDTGNAVVAFGSLYLAGLIRSVFADVVNDPALQKPGTPAGLR